MSLEVLQFDVEIFSGELLNEVYCTTEQESEVEIVTETIQAVDIATALPVMEVKI